MPVIDAFIKTPGTIGSRWGARDVAWRSRSARSRVMSAAVLYVKDLKGMRTFYATCFVMVALEPEGEGLCVLDSVTWELTLVQIPSSIADTRVIADPPRRQRRPATTTARGPARGDSLSHPTAPTCLIERPTCLAPRGRVRSSGKRSTRTSAFVGQFGTFLALALRRSERITVVPQRHGSSLCSCQTGCRRV
jgi:hypothetical protein